MKSLFILCFIAFQYSVSAQSGQEPIIYPKTGEICPDLTLIHVQNYKQNQVQTNELRGQWVILDFWSRTCSGCIASFPRYNTLQRMYADKIKIFLVVYQDEHNKIEPLWSLFKERLHLNLSVGFDSSIFKRLDIEAVPYVIIIDPKGIVRGITNYFTDSTLSDLLKGKDVNWTKVYRQHEKKPTLDIEGYYFGNLSNLNNSTNWYQSNFTKWDNTMPFFDPGSIDYNVGNGIVNILGVCPMTLDKYAYTGKYFLGFRDSLYGKMWGEPILETHDSLRFVANTSITSNSYGYGLRVPPIRSTRKYLMQVMQRDLMNYLGYKVEIQRRKMPIWKLIATNAGKQKLMTKGGPRVFEEPSAYQGYILKNFPISELLNSISSHYQVGPPFIDSTGISGNIDIKLSAFMPDFEEVKNALRLNGLDLVKAEIEMEVIVIKD